MFETPINQNGQDILLKYAQKSLSECSTSHSNEELNLIIPEPSGFISKDDLLGLEVHEKDLHINELNRTLLPYQIMIGEEFSRSYKSISASGTGPDQVKLSSYQKFHDRQKPLPILQNYCPCSINWPTSIKRVPFPRSKNFISGSTSTDILVALHFQSLEILSDRTSRSISEPLFVTITLHSLIGEEKELFPVSEPFWIDVTPPKIRRQFYFLYQDQQKSYTYRVDAPSALVYPSPSLQSTPSGTQLMKGMEFTGGATVREGTNSFVKLADGTGYVLITKGSEILVSLESPLEEGEVSPSPLTALFSIPRQPSWTSLFFSVQISKVFSDSPENALGPYMQTKATPLSPTLASACHRLQSFRQPLALGLFPLFDESLQCGDRGRVEVSCPLFLQKQTQDLPSLSQWARDLLPSDPGSPVPVSSASSSSAGPSTSSSLSSLSAGAGLSSSSTRLDPSNLLAHIRVACLGEEDQFDGLLPAALFSDAKSIGKGVGGGTETTYLTHLIEPEHGYLPFSRIARPPSTDYLDDSPNPSLPPSQKKQIQSSVPPTTRARPLSSPFPSVTSPLVIPPSASFSLDSSDSVTSQKMIVLVPVLRMPSLLPPAHVHSSKDPSYFSEASRQIQTHWTHDMLLFPLKFERFSHRNLCACIELIEATCDNPFPSFDSLSPSEIRVLSSFSSPLDCFKLVPQVLTTLSYHNKAPLLNDYFKLKLPDVVTRSHALRVTVFHVHVMPQNRKASIANMFNKIIGGSEVEDPVQTHIGVGYLPLFQEYSDALIESQVYSIPIIEISESSEATPTTSTKNHVLSRESFADRDRKSMVGEKSAVSIPIFQIRIQTNSSIFSSCPQVQAALQSLPPPIGHLPSSRYSAQDFSVIQSHAREHLPSSETLLKQAITDLMGPSANPVEILRFFLPLARLALRGLVGGLSENEEGDQALPSSITAIRSSSFALLLYLFNLVAPSDKRDDQFHLPSPEESILIDYVEFMLDEELVPSSSPPSSLRSHKQVVNLLCCPADEAIQTHWSSLQPPENQLNLEGQSTLTSSSLQSLSVLSSAMTDDLPPSAIPLTGLVGKRNPWTTPSRRPTGDSALLASSQEAVGFSSGSSFGSSGSAKGLVGVTVSGEEQWVDHCLLQAERLLLEAIFADIVRDLSEEMDEKVDHSTQKPESALSFVLPHHCLRLSDPPPPFDNRREWFQDSERGDCFRPAPWPSVARSALSFQSRHFEPDPASRMPVIPFQPAWDSLEGPVARRQRRKFESERKTQIRSRIPSPQPLNEERDSECRWWPYLYEVITHQWTTWLAYLQETAPSSSSWTGLSISSSDSPIDEHKPLFRSVLEGSFKAQDMRTSLAALSPILLRMVLKSLSVRVLREGRKPPVTLDAESLSFLTKLVSTLTLELNLLKGVWPVKKLNLALVTFIRDLVPLLAPTHIASLLCSYFSVFRDDSLKLQFHRNETLKVQMLKEISLWEGFFSMNFVLSSDAPLSLIEAHLLPFDSYFCASSLRFENSVLYSLSSPISPSLIREDFSTYSSSSLLRLQSNPPSFWLIDLLIEETMLAFRRPQETKLLRSESLRVLRDLLVRQAYDERFQVESSLLFQSPRGASNQWFSILNHYQSVAVDSRQRVTCSLLNLLRWIVSETETLSSLPPDHEDRKELLVLLLSVLEYLPDHALTRQIQFMCEPIQTHTQALPALPLFDFLRLLHLAVETFEFETPFSLSQLPNTFGAIPVLSQVEIEAAKKLIASDSFMDVSKSGRISTKLEALENSLQNRKVESKTTRQIGRANRNREPSSSTSSTPSFSTTSPSNDISSISVPPKSNFSTASLRPAPSLQPVRTGRRTSGGGGGGSIPLVGGLLGGNKQSNTRKWVRSAAPSSNPTSQSSSITSSSSSVSLPEGNDLTKHSSVLVLADNQSIVEAAKGVSSACSVLVLRSLLLCLQLAPPLLNNPEIQSIVDTPLRPSSFTSSPSSSLLSTNWSSLYSQFNPATPLQLFFHHSLSVLLHYLFLHQDPESVCLAFVTATWFLAEFGFQVFLTSLGDLLQDWLRQTLIFAAHPHKPSTAQAACRFLGQLLFACFHSTGSLSRVSLVLLSVFPETLDKLLDKRDQKDAIGLLHLYLRAFSDIQDSCQSINPRGLSSLTSFVASLSTLFSQLTLLIRASIVGRRVSSLSHPLDLDGFSSRGVSGQPNLTSLDPSVLGTLSIDDQEVISLLLQAAEIFPATQLPRHRMNWLCLAAKATHILTKDGKPNSVEEAEIGWRMALICSEVHETWTGLWVSRPPLSWIPRSIGPSSESNVVAHMSIKNEGPVNEDRNFHRMLLRTLHSPPLRPWRNNQHFESHAQSLLSFVIRTHLANDLFHLAERALQASLSFLRRFAHQAQTIGINNVGALGVGAGGAAGGFAGSSFLSFAGGSVGSQYHRRISEMYDSLARGAAQTAEKGISPKMTVGAFYRVQFLGSGLPPHLQGKEFVYRDPTHSHLSAFQTYLKEFLVRQVREGVRVEVLSTSAHAANQLKALETSSNSSLSSEALAILASLKPVFPEIPPFAPSLQVAELSQVSQFQYETPFTRSLPSSEDSGSGQVVKKKVKAHASSIDQQWKRRTLLTVPQPFPGPCLRQLVSRVEVEELSPIEVAMDDIRESTLKMKRMVDLDLSILPPFSSAFSASPHSNPFSYSQFASSPLLQFSNAFFSPSSALTSFIASQSQGAGLASVGLGGGRYAGLGAGGLAGLGVGVGLGLGLGVRGMGLALVVQIGPSPSFMPTDLSGVRDMMRVVQGCVLPQVNMGAAEVARIFLSPSDSTDPLSFPLSLTSPSFTLSPIPTTPLPPSPSNSSPSTPRLSHTPSSSSSSRPLSTNSATLALLLSQQSFQTSSLSPSPSPSTSPSSSPSSSTHGEYSEGSVYSSLPSPPPPPPSSTRAVSAAFNLSDTFPPPPPSPSSPSSSSSTLQINPLRSLPPPSSTLSPPPPPSPSSPSPSHYLDKKGEKIDSIVEVEREEEEGDGEEREEEKLGERKEEDREEGQEEEGSENEGLLMGGEEELSERREGDREGDREGTVDTSSDDSFSLSSSTHSTSSLSSSPSSSLSLSSPTSPPLLLPSLSSISHSSFSSPLHLRRQLQCVMVDFILSSALLLDRVILSLPRPDLSSLPSSPSTPSGASNTPPTSGQNQPTSSSVLPLPPSLPASLPPPYSFSSSPSLVASSSSPFTSSSSSLSSPSPSSSFSSSSPSDVVWVEEMMKGLGKLIDKVLPLLTDVEGSQKVLQLQRFLRTHHPTLLSPSSSSSSSSSLSNKNTNQKK